MKSFLGFLVSFAICAFIVMMQIGVMTGAEWAFGW